MPLPGEASVWERVFGSSTVEDFSSCEGSIVKSVKRVWFLLHREAFTSSLHFDFRLSAFRKSDSGPAAPDFLQEFSVVARFSPFSCNSQKEKPGGFVRTVLLHITMNTTEYLSTQKSGTAKLDQPEQRNPRRIENFL